MGKTSKKLNFIYQWVILKDLHISGCNLSPLLFSLFINSLGEDLNRSLLGLPLGGKNIAAIFFADDIVLIGKDKNSLDHLMLITQKYFHQHHFQLSTSKSKIMNFDASTGDSIFSGNQSISDVTLENVAMFKYLGIKITSSPYNFFRAHNENVKATARKYMGAVLSLTRTGPDRSQLAYALWNCCALPAILYGCEVMPLNGGTIKEIEKCQAKIGKFILQLPGGTSNAAVHIDAGLQPVWSVVAERVMMYSKKLLQKPDNYWPRMALVENILDKQSSYTVHLNEWKIATHADQISRNVKFYAIKKSLGMRKSTFISTFAMNPPGIVSEQKWFQPKSWVNDSVLSRTFAEFRACNVGLGGFFH